MIGHCDESGLFFDTSIQINFKVNWSDMHARVNVFMYLISAMHKKLWTLGYSQPAPTPFTPFTAKLAIPPSELQLQLAAYIFYRIGSGPL